MYVKNAPDHAVRDPDRRDRIPPEGREVPATEYWQRRLKERSVVLADPPVEATDPDLLWPAPDPAPVSEE